MIDSLYGLTQAKNIEQGLSFLGALSLCEWVINHKIKPCNKFKNHALKPSSDPFKGAVQRIHQNILASPVLTRSSQAGRGIQIYGQPQLTLSLRDSSALHLLESKLNILLFLNINLSRSFRTLICDSVLVRSPGGRPRSPAGVNCVRLAWFTRSATSERLGQFKRGLQRRRDLVRLSESECDAAIQNISTQTWSEWLQIRSFSTFCPAASADKVN